MNWKMVKRDTTPVVLGMAMIVNLILSVWIALWMGTELQRHNQSSTLAVITGFIIFMAIGTLLFWVSSLILDDGKEERKVQKAEEEKVKGKKEKTAVAYGEIEILSGMYLGKYFAIPNGERLAMGSSSEECQLIFPIRGINDKQCVIQYDAGQQVYRVTDYSVTGVYLDSGERLPYKVAVPLSKGSILQLGYTENFLKLI